MAARPPPTRPHIGLGHSHFLSRSTPDWGEDDAWDSTSDSESPHVVPPIPRSRTAPKPVPKPASNASSSTLSSSYTHLNAPNVGSYPSKSQDVLVPKNGWTIVRKTRSDSIDEQREQSGSVDVDVEGDMIIGELEQDGGESTVNTKPKHNQGCIRDDVDKIIDGIFSVSRTVFTYHSSST